MLGFVVSFSFSKAQTTTVPIRVLDSLEMGFEIDIQSASTINNAMLNASGFLSQELKDENLSRLGNYNQGGAYTNTKLFYRNKRKSLWGIDRLSYYFALEWKSLNEYQFTKDLYQLVLYGNKSFIDAEADLAYSGALRIDYLQIKGGLYRSSKNEHHFFGFNLGLNIGSKLLAYKFYDPSYIFTSPFGNEIVFQSNVDYMESDTSMQAWYNVSGLGAALDFYYIYTEKNHYSFAVSIENVGFINWNKSSLRFTENKKHSYKGIEVDNIFDASSSIVSTNDTVNSYIYSNTVEGSDYTFTPVDVKMRFEQFFYQKKIKLGFLTHFRLISYMRPIIQLDASYKIKEILQIGPILSYGGYTKFNAGLKLQFNFNNYQIKLESRYLTGFAQHSFSGMGGFINFTYKI